MPPFASSRFGRSSFSHRLFSFAIVAVCLGGILSVSEAVTVNNGNFEIGFFNDFDPTPVNGFYHSSPALESGMAGWQVSVGASIRGSDQFSYDTNGGPVQAPHSGHIAASFENAVQFDTLSQAIATTPGGLYQLHFWLRNPNPDSTSNQFKVTWGGTEVRPLAGAPPLGTNWVLATGTVWTEYVVSNLAATSTSTTLAFSAFNSWATLLDDVSLVTIPEPAAASSFLIGTLGLTLRRRRSRAAA